MENLTIHNDCVLADSRFGPRVKTQCRSFDFTVQFERSIFAILPSSLFILCAAVRIFFLYHARPRVSAPSLRWIKQSLGAILGIMQLCLLVLSVSLESHTQLTSVASLALSVADAVVICVLSYLEHSKTICPSSLLLTYLSTSILLDAACLRTLWLLKSSKPVLRILSSFSLAVKLASLMAESSRKTKCFLNAEDKARSPEEISGIFSNGLFLWLNSLLWVGFRKALTLSDLNHLPQSCNVVNEESGFTQTFERHKAHRHSLVRAIVISFKNRLLWPVIPRLCVLTFTLLQPVLMLKLLQWLEDTSTQDLGYGILGAYGIIYTGLAIATGVYWRFQLQFTTLLRGTLLSAVFQKTLLIRPIDAHKTPMTLINTDIEMACTGLEQLHEVYSSLFQVGIATWLLERQVGVASIAPMIVATVCAVATYKISKHVGICQKGWLESVQTRLNATTSMLSNMKIIQMSGLGIDIFDRIFKLRDAELASASSYRNLLVWIMGLAYLPSAISPVLALAIYAAIQHNIWDSSSAARIYTAISLIGLVTSPLTAVFQQVPGVIAAFSCLKRVEDYLKQPDMMNQEIIANLEFETQHMVSSQKQATASSIPLGDYRSHARFPFAFASHKASFSYPGSEFPVLQNLTIEIPWSKVTLLIGPTGSGKSALIKAMLGELDVSQGTFTKGFESCAYCDQTPWIENQPIQTNIAGPSEAWQEGWYNKTVWACDLEQDIERMLEQDHTEVGSDGATLSGGQKQRVCLARAVYSRQKVIILDDSFSALDPRTEQTVIHRLLGPDGLMRGSEQTVIIASNTERLVPYADFVILLDADGEVKAHEPARQLLQQFPEHLRVADDKKSEPQLEHTSLAEPVAPKQQSKQSKSNDLKMPLLKTSVYRSYFKSMGLWKGLTLCALLTLQTFFSKFPTVWLQWWLDVEHQSMRLLYARYIGVYTLFQVLGLAFTFIAAFHQLRVIMPRTSRYFHTRLLKAVTSLSFPSFSAMSTGSITNRFSQDLQLIDWTLPVTFLNASEGALGTLAQAIIVASASPYIFIAFPVLFTTVIAIQRFYLRTSRQIRSMDIEAKSPLLNYFLETIKGLQTIRAFGWQYRHQATYQSHLNASQRPYYQRFMLQRWLTLVLDLITAGMALLVVGTAIALRTRSALIGLALVNVISMSENLQLLVLQWAAMEISLSSVSRLKAFTHQAAESEHSCQRAGSGLLPQTQPLWPTQGRIEIKQLTARYTADGPAALQDISLTIPPGTKVGICGRTGSGKSTLLATLFAMVSVTQGTVTIDGLDLASLQPETLRSALIGISQDSYIVPGFTVRENLVLGCRRQHQHPCDEDDARLIAALQTVQLWHVIAARGGLSTVLEDPNETLSAGQSQLFACARALLRTGSVVVLDEPASHLTIETAELIRQMIRENFRERTVVAVMHDIKSLLDWDLVVVLEEGHIVQVGRPEELRGQDGVFREMLDTI
ncbi:ABC multidrug transporter [Penicillium longicatenatum]|uniref:ABC multidrug transporter n=1 Tax=Penicillium longicatenatum TaxID=1561947 RepID=UPI00254895F9|nr:ABC multidrug transporter [Penicillium longicatenatum]KAJ5643851.1 ABC multidrug transporter [Penicillium longicatenatum]